MSPLNQVLLIADNETTCFLHQRQLQRLSVAEQLVLVTSREQALDWLKATHEAGPSAYPDLILLDMWRLQDSLAFVQAFQQLSVLQHVPLVLLTAAPVFTLPDLQCLQQLPLAGIVQKPLTPRKAHDIRQLATKNCR